MHECVANVSFIHFRRVAQETPWMHECVANVLLMCSYIHLRRVAQETPSMHGAAAAAAYLKTPMSWVAISCSWRALIARAGDTHTDTHTF
jgi:hypothetical protein